MHHFGVASEIYALMHLHKDETDRNTEVQTIIILCYDPNTAELFNPCSPMDSVHCFELNTKHLLLA